MTTTATNVSVFPPFGTKLTIDPLLNLQEHVSTFLQVSSDMQRAMTIREMLTAREVRAPAISPSTFDIKTRDPSPDDCIIVIYDVVVPRARIKPSGSGDENGRLLRISKHGLQMYSRFSAWIFIG